MLSEQFCSSFLIIPGKPTGAVGRKLDVIRRICIYKIPVRQFKISNVLGGEVPVFECTDEVVEVFLVINFGVSSKGYVELSALIETAKTVETCSVQIIKELSTFRRIRLLIADELIETFTVLIKKRLLIPHRNLD